MGAANITSAGGNDLRSANELAREMIFKCGWSKRLGPMSIMDDEVDYLSRGTPQLMANIGPQTAATAIVEIEELLAAAEAKAFFGLVQNWEVLRDMIESIMERDNHVLNRIDAQALLAKHDVKMFKDCLVDGFGFNADRTLIWPSHYDDLVNDRDETATGRRSAIPIVSKAMHSVAPHVHPLNPYQLPDQYHPMSQEYVEGLEDLYNPEAWRTLKDTAVSSA